MKKYFRYKRGIDYRSMPKPERKDNKLVRVGSGDGYKISDIRFPKKIRKTTWKRFWKLFPMMNGFMTKKEYYKHLYDEE